VDMEEDDEPTMASPFPRLGSIEGDTLDEEGPDYR